MSLNRPEVEKIAHLARLEITEDEMQGFVKNLSRIIDFVDQLQSVDTSGVVPMAHPLHMVQRLRADLVTEPNEREKYQANASKVKAGLYLVPKVIE
ncbi:MAG: Asp-tRNA(Asn)/Glu-tRNA(Gln) amidotransferase subunit GatC [Gammaproteobacteria bacterium]